MSNIFAEAAEIQKAVAVLHEVEPLLKALAEAKVGDKTALQTAEKLFSQAREHKVTVELAVAELLDPKTAKEEFERLLKAAQDHHSEFSQFLDQCKTLVAAELAAAEKATK